MGRVDLGLEGSGSGVELDRIWSRDGGGRGREVDGWQGGTEHGTKTLGFPIQLALHVCEQVKVG